MAKSFTPNPPTAPTTESITSMYTFPSDLDRTGFTMTFAFGKYMRDSYFGDAKISPISTTITLPMPDYINDVPTVEWREDSFGTDTFRALEGIAKDGWMLPGGMSSIADKLADYLRVAGVAIDALGWYQGFKVNPFMVMAFQNPHFKRFQFSWILAPRNAGESLVLNQIVQTFRNGMLPKRKPLIPLIWDYPLIVHPSFNPDIYMFKFKHCAINGAVIDYTPAGRPVFHEDTFAPFAVKLTIDLTEIDLWEREGDI
jgi:hypothetical protein